MTDATTVTTVPTEWTTLATGLRFPEGPVAMDDGSVLLVEIERGTLSRVSPDGTVDVVADCGGGPNGAAIGPDGAVWITNNGGCFEFVDLGGMLVPGPVPSSWSGGCIQKVDPASGSVQTVYTECDGRPLRAPNDLVFDRHGGFWFTDHGVQGDPLGIPRLLVELERTHRRVRRHPRLHPGVADGVLGRSGRGPLHDAIGRRCACMVKVTRDPDAIVGVGCERIDIAILDALVDCRPDPFGESILGDAFGGDRAGFLKITADIQRFLGQRQPCHARG